MNDGAGKSQTQLCIESVSPGPLLFAHTIVKITWADTSIMFIGPSNFVQVIVQVWPPPTLQEGVRPHSQSTYQYMTPPGNTDSHRIFKVVLNKKKNQYLLFVWGWDRLSVPHRLSSLGKPCDVNRWSSGADFSIPSLHSWYILIRWRLRLHVSSLAPLDTSAGFYLIHL